MTHATFDICETRLKFLFASAGGTDIHGRALYVTRRNTKCGKFVKVIVFHEDNKAE